MKLNIIKKELSIYYHIMRLNKPIGIMLLLWPTMWALWLATPGFPPKNILLIFILGSILMRSAGCVVNDYIDRKIDIYVKRTSNRPLPNGLITEKKTIVLFIILILISCLLITFMNKTIILFSLIALLITCIYPFTKRYINFPQLILGIAFSLSIPMSFFAINETTSITCWLLFVTNILWVIVYDTEYSMVDRDDDLKIGVKSTAIFFGHNDRLFIGILQILVLILMLLISYINNLKQIFYITLIIIMILFVYQQKLLSQRKRKAYFKAFMNNNYIGLIFFLGLLINYL